MPAGRPTDYNEDHRDTASVVLNGRTIIMPSTRFKLSDGDELVITGQNRLKGRVVYTGSSLFKENK